MKLSGLFLLTTLFVVTSQFARATNAATDPVGFMTISTPLGSDTIIGAPLTKAPVFQGVVSSRNGFAITSTGANFGDLASSPHYVQPVSGSQAGMIFDVASNSADTITLVDNGINPTGLDANTQFKVVSYWTLGEIYPASAEGVSFTGSGTSGSSRRTQILFPSLVGSGINRSPASTFFFVTNADPAQAYWRKVGAGAANFNNEPILPDSYFTVRQTTNSAQNVSLATTVVGSVNTGATVVQLDSVNGSQNDNYVSLGRPTDITLNSLGLITSGAFTPSTGTSGGGRRDQLLIISNSVIGQNKSPSTTYYYISNATTTNWVVVGGGTNDVGSDVIPAATGYIIRKASQNATGSTFWTNHISIAQ